MIVSSIVDDSSIDGICNISMCYDDNSMFCVFCVVITMYTLLWKNYTGFIYLME